MKHDGCCKPEHDWKLFSVRVAHSIGLVPPVLLLRWHCRRCQEEKVEVYEDVPIDIQIEIKPGEQKVFA